MSLFCAASKFDRCIGHIICSLTSYKCPCLLFGHTERTEREAVREREANVHMCVCVCVNMHVHVFMHVQVYM